MKNHLFCLFLLLCAGCAAQNRSTGNIVVAMVDTGIDIDHKELKHAIWQNPGEIAANGIDDDRNGYVDDANGWNFLGNSDGSFNVIKVGTQAFREYKRLRPKYADVGGDRQPLPEECEEYEYYKRMEAAAGINSYMKFVAHLEQIAEAFVACDALLAERYPERKNFDAESVIGALAGSDGAEAGEAVEIVSQRYLFEKPDIVWGEIFDKNVSEYEQAIARIQSLDDPADDPRIKVGDELTDFNDLYYGNNNISLPDSGQGTALAGLIVAAGDNPYGVKGVCPDAKIMVVRALPEGDVYDKDVAAAIRYAVDNGARVINLGFAKNISPDSGEVQKAVRYAARKDVLIVRGAGDKGVEVVAGEWFPSAIDRRGRRNRNMIVVGAAAVDGTPASFSNYGKDEVDIFAPGSNVLTTYPGDRYMYVEGTDVAAALTSGVAAVIRARYPRMKARKVRELLIESALPVMVDGVDVYEGKCIAAGLLDTGEAAGIMPK